MNWFALGVMILAISELTLFLVVRLARHSFPWLITEQDEIPKLDVHALQKFLEYSFDADLGWVRKPNFSGVEQGQKGDIKFQIDSTGARFSGIDKLTPVMAAFGDSYIFCRQVEDDETWEVQLSNQKGFDVLNYGVGNYGIDQALLRYEGMTLASTVRIVVLGFVPETICRIQSYWKHYLEFGNTFAFKPRFVLGSAGQLSLLKNPMRNAGDFTSFLDILPKIQEADGFYKKKFRSLQFRTPYVLSLLRNPARQIKLISAIVFRWLMRTIGMSTPWSDNVPFSLVMRDNIRDAHKLYSDREATDLLKAIVLRFKEVARSRGHTPLVLLIPQLLDIKLTENSYSPYQRFFQTMNSLIPVLDLTDKFSSNEIDKLYINDQYGGHLSPAGNLLVAKEISAWLEKLNLNPWYS